MKGKFIVFEGIDGCGKTTQINHIKDWLPKSGLILSNNQVKITKEPGGTNIGERLRDLLLDTKKEITPEDLTELLLYTADRAEHVSKVIRPSIESGQWILSDRYIGSTIAYQGFGRGIDQDIINSLINISTKGLQPDMTIWLDLDVELSIKRRENVKNDRIESEGYYFLKRVSAGFAYLSKKYQWQRIKADKPKEEVNQLIEKIMLDNLK